MKKFNKVIAFALLSVVLVACGTTKTTTTPTGQKEVEIKQNECQIKYVELGEKGKLVGLGEGISPRGEMAKRIAKVNARQEISTVIQTAIASYFEKYAKNYDTGTKVQFEERVQDTVKEIVDQKISGVTTICQKTYALGTNYKVYVCMELKGDVIGNIADEISKNKKLQIDFDADKFRKIAEEELKKYRERNN